MADDTPGSRASLRFPIGKQLRAAGEALMQCWAGRDGAQPHTALPGPFTQSSGKTSEITERSLCKLLCQYSLQGSHSLTWGPEWLALPVFGVPGPLRPDPSAGDAPDTRMPTTAQGLSALKISPIFHRKRRADLNRTVLSNPCQEMWTQIPRFSRKAVPQLFGCAHGAGVELVPLRAALHKPVLLLFTMTKGSGSMNKSVTRPHTIIRLRTNCPSLMIQRSH